MNITSGFRGLLQVPGPIDKIIQKIFRREFKNDLLETDRENRVSVHGALTDIA